MSAQKLSGPDDAGESQATLSAEINEIGREYEDAVAAGAPVETQPRLDYPPYRSSLLRHPTKDLRHADPETIELHSPAFGRAKMQAFPLLLSAAVNAATLYLFLFRPFTWPDGSTARFMW